MGNFDGFIFPEWLYSFLISSYSRTLMKLSLIKLSACKTLFWATCLAVSFGHVVADDVVSVDKGTVDGGDKNRFSESANDPMWPRYWPRAWFEPLKTASQLGITELSQSPWLDSHDLPPVEQRLPVDPVVVTPLADIGRYGGTMRIDRNEWLTFPNVEGSLTISADMRTVLPNLAESWKLSADGRRLTMTLREGVKWSNGVPHTSDDYLFVFNDLWHNEEYEPVTRRIAQGGRAVKVSDRIFYYEFEDPNPQIVNYIAHYGNFMLLPKHYYQNFHPAYVDRETLDRKIADMGFISWVMFIEACRLQDIEESAEPPTMDAFQIVEYTPKRTRMVRNPYYFKIDPAGQQLPYIDAVVSQDIESKEVIAAMSATGQLDFSAYELKTQDIPLLKLGELSGDIQVLIWNRLHSVDVAIEFNYNHEDKKLSSLYWERRFRVALSLALNREEMNQIIYFGRGTPRQVTAHPSSRMFVPEYATAYTQYDPDRARSLLDELGLKDVDGDGLREYPDGEPLTITLEFMDWETPKAITLELVSVYWREVGIDVRLKIVDMALQTARAHAGKMQMTGWHADRVTDIFMPQMVWWAPVHSGFDNTMWNDWVRWHRTDGEIGTKPPAVIRELQQWSDEVYTTVDSERRIELGKKLLESNARNLWTIGTVGLAPQPVVISSKLRGVTNEGIWGWDNRWTLSYHPSTWYFESNTTIPGTTNYGATNNDRE